jgi:hypothetical protein
MRYTERSQLTYYDDKTKSKKLKSKEGCEKVDEQLGRMGLGLVHLLAWDQ